MFGYQNEYVDNICQINTKDRAKTFQVEASEIECKFSIFTENVNEVVPNV